MAIEGSSSSPASSAGLVQQLDKASEKIEKLNEKYNQHKEISKEVQTLIPVLKSCNVSIEQKKFTADPELGENESIDHLLHVLQVFPFSAIDRDVATRQKIGMFAAFINEVNVLERHLKDLKKDLRKWRDLKKWRTGQNVEGIFQGKPGGGQS